MLDQMYNYLYAYHFKNSSEDHDIKWKTRTCELIFFRYLSHHTTSSYISPQPVSFLWDSVNFLQWEQCLWRKNNSFQGPQPEIALACKRLEMAIDRLLSNVQRYTMNWYSFSLNYSCDRGRWDIHENGDKVSTHSASRPPLAHHVLLKIIIECIEPIN